MYGGSWATGRWSSWPPTRDSWGRSRRRWRRSPRTRPASTGTPSWATSCARRWRPATACPPIASRWATGRTRSSATCRPRSSTPATRSRCAGRLSCPTGWPRARWARRVAAAPLRGSSYDLDALLGVIGPRTRIAYVCNPNNPTGGIVGREQLAAFVAAVPERVLVVVDEAYHEYVEDPELPGRGRRARRARRTCACCAPSRRCTASPACGSAMRSPRRRWQRRSPRCGRRSMSTSSPRSRRLPAWATRPRSSAAAVRTPRAVSSSPAIFASSACEPLVSHGNFLTVEVGDAPAVAGQLEAEGVIVRPLGGFGDPRSIRITVGTPEQNAMCVAALGRVLQAVG